MPQPLEPLGIRLQLLARGYKPLPASTKAVFLTGWPSVRVTKKSLREWSTAHPGWGNTGLRCDDLVAVDVDITRPDLGERVLHSALRILGAPGAVRVGSPPKFLLLYRRAEGKGAAKASTGRWATPAAVEAHARREEVDGQQVEVLRGAGCQFIAYGKHPRTGGFYAWPDLFGGRGLGPHPLELDKDALPAVADDQVLDFLAEATAHLEAAGLVRLRSNREAGALAGEGYATMADLSGEETVLVCGPAGWAGVVTVDDLERRLAADTEVDHVRIVSPHSASRRDSGLAALNDDGTLRIVDFTDDTVRVRPPEDRPTTKAVPALGEALKDERAVWADKLLREYAYVVTEDACYHVDYTGNDDAIAVEAMRRMTRRLTMGDGDGTLIVDRWMRDASSLKADARMFDPRRSDRVFEVDGRRFLNTYRGPGWDAVRGDGERGVSLFLAFIEHLAPVPEEREVLLDWLANKVQRPWERMFGMLMVAPQVFGTGRGTLADIMSRLLGHRYVLEVKFKQFIGAGSQGQYYDWLYESLLVHVPEVYGKGSSYKDKIEAFERLKEIVDPSGSLARHLPRKFAKAANTSIYASALLGTNFRDALPIPKDDRRLYVLSNGEPLSEEMRGDIYKSGWIDDSAALGGVWRWLMARTVTTDLQGRPAETEAKRVMADSVRSDLDLAWEMFCDFVRECGSDIFTHEQFKAFCRNVVPRRSDLDLGDELERVTRRGGATFFSAKGSRGGGRCYVGGKQLRFRELPGGAVVDAEADPSDLLARVDKSITEATRAVLRGA